mgnify:CR=1 FL=1
MIHGPSPPLQLDRENLSQKTDSIRNIHQARGRHVREIFYNLIYIADIIAILWDNEFRSNDIHVEGSHSPELVFVYSVSKSSALTPYTYERACKTSHCAHCSLTDQRSIVWLQSLATVGILPTPEVITGRVPWIVGASNPSHMA